jgi:hypothetical protein
MEQQAVPRIATRCGNLTDEEPLGDTCSGFGFPLGVDLPTDGQ